MFCGLLAVVRCSLFVACFSLIVALCLFVVCCLLFVFSWCLAGLFRVCRSFRLWFVFSVVWLYARLGVSLFGCLVFEFVCCCFSYIDIRCALFLVC